MDDLDQQLREALARKDAPAGFEARVHAAAGRRAAPRWSALFGLPVRLRWATAAVAATLLIAGLWQHERSIDERAAGEAASRQLMTALQITSDKLHTIQQKVVAVSYGHEEKSQ